MDFQQFYPTPKNLAGKLVQLISDNAERFALEPSAGEGALVAALQNRWGGYKKTIHCIELSPARAGSVK